MKDSGIIQAKAFRKSRSEFLGLIAKSFWQRSACGIGNVKCAEHFFFHFLVDTCYFMGLLIILFWTSDDIFSGLKSQSGQPYSHLAEEYVTYVPWDSSLM